MNNYKKVRCRDAIDFMIREELDFKENCVTKLFYYDPDNPIRDDTDDGDYYTWLADWGNKTYFIQIEDPWHRHDSDVFVKDGKINGKGAIKNKKFILKFIEHYEQGILEE
jgi:hypothetical protein